MVPPYESEIRARLAEALERALGTAIDARRIRLPARAAHASFRPPQGAAPAPSAAPDCGPLYGAPLVERVRAVNGWLLFDLSPAFFSALVTEVNAALPAPETAGETHAENRMRALARHEGSGCPDHPAFHRALIEAVAAHESPAALRRAERAAKTLFHAVAPIERPALLSRCGALGGALWRLLFAARRHGAAPSQPARSSDRT